jgi:hypothetical protein
MLPLILVRLLVDLEGIRQATFATVKVSIRLLDHQPTAEGVGGAEQSHERPTQDPLLAVAIARGFRIVVRFRNG